MSAHDREKWDARWRERGPSAEPSRLLTALDLLLPRTGRALDVGGGAGRHASWLADRGLEVTVADVSPVALELARAEAAARGARLATIEIDLEVEPLPAGPWALILCFHFLERHLFPSYRAALAPGGVLVVVHPTRRNLERHASPSARFLLEEGELGRLAGELEVLRLDEGWLDGGRHEARLVARRPW